MLIAYKQYFTRFMQKITGIVKKPVNDLKVVINAPMERWVGDNPVELPFQFRESIGSQHSGLPAVDAE